MKSLLLKSVEFNVSAKTKTRAKSPSSTWFNLWFWPRNWKNTRRRMRPWKSSRLMQSRLRGTLHVRERSFGKRRTDSQGVRGGWFSGKNLGNHQWSYLFWDLNFCTLMHDWKMANLSKDWISLNLYTLFKLIPYPVSPKSSYFIRPCFPAGAIGSHFPPLSKHLLPPGGSRAYRPARGVRRGACRLTQGKEAPGRGGWTPTIAAAGGKGECGREAKVDRSCRTIGGRDEREGQGFGIRDGKWRYIYIYIFLSNFFHPKGRFTMIYRLTL